LQLWFWYGFSYDVDMGQHCDYDGPKVWIHMFIYIYYKFLKTYQNHIRQNHIKIASASTSHQNHIKTVSKSYQHNSKFTPLNKLKIDPKPVPGLFLFPFLKPTHWEPWKRCSVPKPCQNHIKIISKGPQPYLNHNPNHIKKHINTM
jgi:hypothetical protein